MNKFWRVLRDLFGPAAAQRSAFDDTDASRITRSAITGMSADAEVHRDLWKLRAECRGLEKSNDYVRKFLNELEANVIGSEGVVLQMKVKEEGDRVIHDPTEKAFLEDWQAHRNDRRGSLRKRLERIGLDAIAIHELLPDVKHIDRAAKVLKGSPDVYANDQIEKAWKRWKQRENCTASKQLEFHEVEKLQLRTNARDGDLLIRKLQGFENEFGFTLQLIDPDWLDHNFNRVIENGNEVRMGIEFNKWKEPVAYHILTRLPGRWQWGTGLSGYGGNGAQHERIAAEEIIHPFIRERIDQSRGLPWFLSTLTRLGLLGRYEEAELLQSLGAACKGGNYYNDLDPSADMPPGVTVDPNTGQFVEQLAPGQVSVSKYGWKYQSIDPTHPNGDYPGFRTGVLQGVAAGLPGSTYHALSQDPAGLSWSNLRGIENTAQQAWMMIQHWEINTALHRPVFESWLPAALVSRQVPLPVSKELKYRAASWTGRRWKSVDPVKEAQAHEMNLKLGLTTRTKIIAESDNQLDFEENLEQLVIEDAAIRETGLDSLLLENIGAKAAMPATDPNDEDDDEDEDPDADPPKPKNGKHLNGDRLQLT